VLKPLKPEKMCSKCGVFVAARNHAWCVECKAEHQAGNREAKLRMARASGYAEGVDAAIETLAQEFARLGDAKVTCMEVAAAIRHSPRPQFKIAC
jgi:hypothetical protein